MTSSDVQTLRWMGTEAGHLVLIDQTLLPVELKEIECHDVQSVWEAIKLLRVRGAPAIGIAAAYGVVLGMQSSVRDAPERFLSKLVEVVAYLASSRPTAVNLFWALNRMQKVAESSGDRPSDVLLARLWDESVRIHDEDRQVCHAIGRHGAALLSDGQGVLTHCNAGGLATAEYGTALSIFFTAQDDGKRLQVYVDETRPLLQGSRLTAWELTRRDVDTTLICDNMAGQVMREGRVQAVVTGADRIAANGDSANKIGTYSVALLAAAHQIPFYIAAPTSTFDLTLASGVEIPIEQRDAAEVTHGFGRQTAPTGIAVYNPAFDVTPAKYIKAIITERGVIEPVTAQRVSEVVAPEA